MLQNFITKMLIVFFTLGVTSYVDAQSGRIKRKKKKTTEIQKPKPKAKPKKGAILPYGKVVTKEMKTDEGLFKVHSADNTYLFGCRDTLQ